ncbi:MAG: hypothetical protein EKK46_01270 [Rhodocyclaceae bacterium]|nr:MAG: hypothetical protein EKK46_01270 [Rhodocyclaceae bacterium]
MGYYCPMSTSEKNSPVFPDPIRVAEHPALDFANTLAAPAGEAVDFILLPEAFLAWARDTAGTDEVYRLALEAQKQGDLPDAVIKARALRDWLRALLPRIAKGDAANDTGITAELNRILAAGSHHWRLRAQGNETALALEAMYAGPDSVVAALAVLVGRLLTEVSADTVRKCENPACILWFRDTSKRGNRRWCSMGACGNRAKAAAHRQRRRETED